MVQEKTKELKNRKQAESILIFFYSGKAFTWKLPERQKKSIKERIDNALNNKSECKYWFFENENGDVIAAGAVQKEDQSVGGYFVGWLGVHENYRRKGFGREIVLRGEDYIKKIGGKFIIIETADDNKEANSFYRSLGYSQVGLIPDYYGKSGKVTYYKKLK